jgi:hypothetical protein
MDFPDGEKVQMPVAVSTSTLRGERYAKGKQFMRILHHAVQGSASVHATSLTFAASKAQSAYYYIRWNGKRCLA